LVKKVECKRQTKEHKAESRARSIWKWGFFCFVVCSYKTWACVVFWSLWPVSLESFDVMHTGGVQQGLKGLVW